MSDLHAGHRAMLLNSLRQQGQSGHVLVGMRGQAAGSHGNRYHVIHENQASAAFGSFCIGLDLTVAYRAIRIAKVSAHGVAHDAILDYHVAQTAFFKQLGIVLVFH